MRPVLVLAASVALVAGCTASGEETRPTAEQTVPNQVPDDVAAVTDPPRPSDTEVVLSFVGWDEDTSSVQVGGYVTPVVEDGGTCTVDLTRGDVTVEVSGPAVADATTTVCGGLTVPGDQLSAGTWEAVLRYESPLTSGASESLPVEVPE
jgi:hypothetical protein